MSGWGRARELAGRTPASRNRYVDLLRAVSILAVVTGHWLIAAPSVRDGELRLDHMLAVSPWTQWLTWLFQVMPVFFMVGGYSNAASWEAASRAGRGYGGWAGARLRRLVGPIVPLLVVWGVVAVIARRLGVAPEMVRVGSQAALVPLWFLAVYVLVVLLVPLTHGAWRRFGAGSLWALVLAAVAVDAARFGLGHVWIGWANYLFVWLAVHQLGYLWRSGGIRGPGRALFLAAGGIAVLLGLIRLAGYPLSMVGVPGEEVSNTLPPSLAMLALAAVQAGLLLALEAPARRWLEHPRRWALTILVNGMIMSVYLWHLSVLDLAIASSHALGGVGLHIAPGTGLWWATRPLWMLLLASLLLLVLPLVGRFERLREPAAARDLPAWRAVLGSSMVCAALALLALDGIGTAGALGVRVGVLVTALAGALLVRATGTFSRP